MDSSIDIWLIGSNEEDYNPFSEVLADRKDLTIHRVSELEIADDKSISKTIASRPAPLLIAFEYTILRKLGSRLLLHLRKTRMKVRILCLCKDWPDAESHFWLNSVLQVSLVVLEPILPNLLCHEIDKTLRGAKELFSCISNNKSDFIDSNWLQESKSEQSEIERRILETIVILRKQALEEWKRLGDDLLKYRNRKDDDTLRKSCFSRAHNLKGTFGSLGLKEIGERASEIEYCLTMQIPSEPCDEALWWHFLTDTLSSGDIEKNIVKVASADSISCINYSGINKAQVVLIGAKAECMHLAGSLRGLGFDASIASDGREVNNIPQDFDCCTIVILSAMQAFPRFEICRFLNSRRYDKKWHIIYIEDSISESLRADIFSCGAESILDIPEPQDGLVMLLEEHCAHSKAE